jgi:hypothetical protein
MSQSSGLCSLLSPSDKKVAMANSLVPPRPRTRPRKSRRSQGLPPLPTDGVEPISLSVNIICFMPLVARLDEHTHTPPLDLTPQQQTRESAAPAGIPLNIAVARPMPTRAPARGSSQNYYNVQRHVRVLACF